MKKSLFTPLKEEGYTTLKIRHNWKKGTFRLYIAKDWDQDLDFSKYNKEFYCDDILTDSAVYLGTKEVRDLYKKYDLEEYLDEILDLVKQGRHFGMDCYYNDKFNIKFMCNQHSRKLGINKKRHAIMAGGIRRHPLEDEEKEVIIDGLNLGRAMSFKNVAAGIDFGGCKTTVHMDELDLENMEIMGFLAYAMDNCRTMTGPDMYFPTEMADVMNDNFSVQYTNGPKNSPLGETGKPTAYGAYLALKQAVKFKTGSESLDGMKIAVQGLGAVGWYMVEYLMKEDVKLYITARKQSTVDKFVAEHTSDKIIPVDNTEILNLDCDILCPCAIGGIITEELIPKLKFKYIFGPANNQLRASSQDEEERLAKLLADKGILFQTEWWHNTAGVICGAEEYLYGKDATYEGLERKIEEILPVKTWENLNKAKELGITPTECAYKTCYDIIYGD